MVNHGVPEHIINDAMNVMKEFFNMSTNDKVSTNPNNGWIYTGSTGYTKDGVYLWRDNLKFTCHPLVENTTKWPEKPTKLR